MRVTICLLVILCTAIIGIEGCVQPIDRRPRPDPDIVDPVEPVAPTNANAIWQALAERIDRGTFQHSDELLGTIKELKAAGDLSDADVRKFESQFGDLLKSRRPLTPDDSRRLKLLSYVHGTEFIYV